MRWFGWVFAGLLLVGLLLVRDHGRRAVAAEQQAVDADVAARRGEVESVLERAAAVLPVRREQLDAETRKVGELERQLADLEQTRGDRERTAKELSSLAEDLRKSTEEATGKQEDDRERSRELRGRIAAAEVLVDRLQKAVARVTEKGAP